MNVRRRVLQVLFGLGAIAGFAHGIHFAAHHRRCFDQRFGERFGHGFEAGPWRASDAELERVASACVNAAKAGTSTAP